MRFGAGRDLAGEECCKATVAIKRDAGTLPAVKDARGHEGHPPSARLSLLDQRSANAGSARPDRHRWHQAAEHARFRFFEPVGPGRTSVWAGGFGWDRDEPSHLAVLASVDGVEVKVDTTLSSPRSHRGSRERLVLDLLFDYVMHEGAELVLPMSIEVVADDRMISVAGQDLLFSGMRIATSGRWAGEVEHDGVVIRAVTSTHAPAFSIEVCSDWRSMAEFPTGAS